MRLSIGVGSLKRRSHMSWTRTTSARRRDASSIVYSCRLCSCAPTLRGALGRLVENHMHAQSSRPCFSSRGVLSQYVLGYMNSSSQLVNASLLTICRCACRSWNGGRSNRTRMPK
ncbi:hypothetical protein EXIGLDRAFT_201866 [Exidia glandulosa HHB12029]|uniref:Uncharacterized protein n=1 Tax=Exidia glandulosa HHB12029 TaxID=1314781 RepID=A0A165EQK1_EXIGL|nr:hypothetical protein EXIGLDRAFT_201866 [Exidia glandulosa HHB12029]